MAILHRPFASQPLRLVNQAPFPIDVEGYALSGRNPAIDRQVDRPTRQINKRLPRSAGITANPDLSLNGRCIHMGRA